MRYLWNLVYLAALTLAAPWLILRAWRTGRYRRGWREKLLGQLPERVGDAPCVWLHAVSVGEVNVLVPLVRALREKLPQAEVVISTTTATGYELAQRRFADLTVCYAPLDFSWAVQNALRRVRPTLLVLAELELWPNWIDAARRHGARVAIINGRLSARSFAGYRRLAWLVGPVLRGLNVIAVQDASYAERFAALGAEPSSLVVTGSIKYDGARSDRNHPQTAQLRALAGIEASDIVFLAGSTQAPEEACALQTYLDLRSAHPRLRLILVPRHPERFDEVARLLDARGVAWQRRSQLATEGTRPEARILLVDTIGELGAWWGTAEIAFVGGSFGSRGGQNMLEPAAYGAAVSFGPNTHNFRDIVDTLLKHDAAEVVADADALTAFVRRCLEQPQTAQALGDRARRLVWSQQGATARTLERLSPLIERQEAVIASIAPLHERLSARRSA